jgi:hypothetical protein
MRLIVPSVLILAHDSKEGETGGDADSAGDVSSLGRDFGERWDERCGK